MSTELFTGTRILARLSQEAKTRVSALTTDYVEGLLEDLQNPHEAAAYLTAALEDGSEEEFLLALRHVMAAKGIKSHIFLTEAQYENRAEMLTHPHLSKLLRLLANMGLRLEIAVKESFAT